jgi:hypothetical protein
MWTFDAGDRFVTRKIVHYFCDQEVNGWIGRQMPRLFAEAGLIDIKALPVTTFLEDYKTMSDLYLAELLARAHSAEIVSRNEGKAWVIDLPDSDVFRAAKPFSE